MSYSWRRSRVSAAQFCLLFLSLLVSGPSSARAQAAPQIIQEINDQVITRLNGNTHPLANVQNDRGVVASSASLKRMLLVLKRSAAQDKSLAAAIAAMHQPGSPSFHHWLTPEQIGAQYGPNQSDVNKVVEWLGEQGFTVSSVSKAHSVIEFSGTAQAVANAFHTEIHNYAYQGSLYTANSSDPSIPSALAPVVAGFASLNNFPRGHVSSQPSQVKFDKETKKWFVSKPTTPLTPGAKPQFTTVLDGYTFYPVTPADFATIYNLNPLFNSGIDGTGQQIAIVAESDIIPSDINTFRSAFGLPPAKLNIIMNGPDPGQTIADGPEPTIDAEWSGAVAKNATIDFVISQTTSTTQGTDLSAMYIIDNQVAPVMSESYGSCESAIGDAGNQFYYQTWQQAAAEGITAIVSAGDSGAAGCDQNQPASSHGDAVNGLASTPYTVAIGGTDFEVSTTNPAPYWNTFNDPTNLGSALSYIPEVPWNSSCGSPEINAVYAGNFGSGSPEALCNNANASEYLGAVGGGGGASNCVETNSSNQQCVAGYPQPTWQNGINGIADGTARYVPDVSLFAANGAFGSLYLFCEADLSPDSVCDYSNPDSIEYFGAGGTSFGAPAFAGIMALVNQKMGSAQGLANYVLYSLGRQQYGTTAAPNTKQTIACNASAGPGQGNSCTFYDVAQGSNAQPCFSGSTGCATTNAGDTYGILAGYTSNPGYDAVTGLGSVNATNLVNNWSAVTQAGSSTTLSITPTTLVYGSTITASGAVTAATGTPTGEVALLADQQSFGASTLASGAYTQSLAILPAGSYSATANYLGDGNFSKSTSAAVPLIINKANSSGTMTFSAVNPYSGAVLSNNNQIPYGSMMVGTFTVQGVTGVAGIHAPTGSVNFTQGGTTVGLNALNGATATANMIAGMPPGGGNWGADYTGDTNYLASPPVTANFTIVQANTALEAHATPPVVAGNNSVTLSSTITSFSYAAPPMGTVTFFLNGTSVGTASAIPGADPVSGAGLATATLTIAASQLQAGTNIVTASYGGNTDFNPSNSGQSTVLYGSGALTSNIAFTANSDAVTNSTPVTLSASVTLNSSPAPVGIVNFYDGKTLLAAVPVVGVNPAKGATTGTAKLVTLLPTGTHSLTAVYGGVGSTIQAATSAATTVTVTGSAPSSTTLSAKADALIPANYDFAAQVFAGGTTVPTGSVTINEPTLGGTLGTVSLDASTAVSGLAPEEELPTAGNPGVVTTGDFNGDGIVDLAVTNSSAGLNGSTQLQVFLGKGDGTYASPLSSIISYNPNIAEPLDIVRGDFNGDGIPDIALAFDFGGEITILLGNGDGTFSDGPSISVPGGFPVLNSIAVSDFNHDGIQDIGFVDFSDGAFGVALGNGDGSFQNVLLTKSLAPNRVVAGDVNNDGKPDIVLVHPFSNSVGVALGNGDGTFQAEVSYPTTGQTPWGLSLGDLNHDGFLDFVTADQGDGTVAIALNNGDGTYGTAVTYTVGSFPQTITIGDMNHDGIPDVIAANNAGNSLTILNGNGDGTFKPGTTVKTGHGPQYPLVADVNNDGLSDLVVAENLGGNVGVFLNGVTLTGSVSNIAVDGAVTEKQTVSATYSGDSNYATSPSPVLTLSASGATTPTSLKWAPTASSGVYGTVIPGGVLNAQVTDNVPGTIAYSTQIAGVGVSSVTASTVLPAAGAYTLSATFVPTSAKDYANATAQTIFTVSQASVSQTLSASASQVAPGAPLTITDVVISSTSGTPTGVVNFSSGSSSIGAAALDATGHASLTISNLPTGTASITASYLGDNNFTTNNASGPSITVGTPGFLVSLPSGSLALTSGSSATAKVSVASALSFAGNVSMSCGNLPVGMTCSFAPASGPLSSSPFQSTVTISAAGASTGAATRASINPWFGAAGGTGLACLVLLGLPIRANRRLRGLLVLILCGSLAGLSVGCGGSSTSPTPTSTLANSTVILTSSGPKAACGTIVTLQAEVGGANGANTTGSVVFFDGATRIGQPVTVTSGQASLQVPTLSVGTHTITATYSGDSHNSASSSSALQQVITGNANIQIIAVSGSQTQTANLPITLQ